MLDRVLREGFRAAHRRLSLIFFDLLWKFIWCVLTLASFLLVAVWFAAEFRSIGWVDTGNRAINGVVALAVLRQFWAAHRTGVIVAVGAVLFFSLLLWFVLEAAFRSRIVSGRFNVFLASNLLKCLVVSTAVFALASIGFGRYFVIPLSEWRQLWPDMRGPAFVCLVTLAALGLLLTIVDTLVRSDAIELLGTDLFRVTGLIGILLLFEIMISGSCVVMLGAGFLNIAGWKNALVMLGAAALTVVFISALHSYLLLVRFYAVDIMRQNVVEV